MKKNKFLILALVITLLGFLLCLWHLGGTPPSLTWDEAAWGYNAYSILKTGRDEYGNFLPLILKSFGDYKPGLYVYLVALSEAIFGLNEFVVRLPSALFGSLGIFLLYLVVKELFTDFKGKEIVALTSSLVLATSPWHYHFSHSGWEANVLVTTLLLGIWLFLKSDNKRPRFLYFSALSFGLSFYLYQGAKMLVPIITFGLLLFFWKEIKKIPKKTLVISFTILMMMALPIYLSVFFGGAGGRLKVMSVFSYPRSTEEAETIAKEGETTPQSLEFQVFHGSLNYYARGILGRYFSHFSSRFLFFEGDWTNQRHSASNAGVLNRLSILFLPIGAYFLVKEKIRRQAFLWYLLLLGPLPAAFTRDIIQAHRTLFMIIPLTILTAFGIYGFALLIKKWPLFLRLGVGGGVILGWFFFFFIYLDQFFVHAPIADSAEWLYGYREAVEFIGEKTNDYDQVVFTQRYGQPYIYYLFYTAYEPGQYQPQAKLVEHPEGDVGRIERIDNIEFRDIYWPEDRDTKNTLFIGGPYEIPLQDITEEESRVLKEINYLNGELAFRIVETVK